MTDTISKAAKERASALIHESVYETQLKYNAPACMLTERNGAVEALARVLQEHSNIAKVAYHFDRDAPCPICGGIEGCSDTVPERRRAWAEHHLQSMILPDDEPDEVDEISRDLLQRIAHGDSEHREWLKRELSRHLRIVAAGYEIRRRDG